jgi:hypothetical protein
VFNLFKKKPCAACEAKDKHIAYLEKLVDSTLLSKGVAPVHARVVDGENEDENAESTTMRFGDDE